MVLVGKRLSVECFKNFHRKFFFIIIIIIIKYKTIKIITIVILKTSCNDKQICQGLHSCLKNDIVLLFKSL